MGVIGAVLVDPAKKTWNIARHDSVIYALAMIPVNLERGIREGARIVINKVRRR